MQILVRRLALCKEMTNVLIISTASGEALYTAPTLVLLVTARLLRYGDEPSVGGAKVYGYDHTIVFCSLHGYESQKKSEDRL